MKQHVGLASKKCIPCEAGKATALTDAETNSYRNQVPGWRLVKDSKGHLCLQQAWKVRNFKAGLEAFGRIGQIAEEEGHHPDLHLEGYNSLSVQLCTHSVGKCMASCAQLSVFWHLSSGVLQSLGCAVMPKILVQVGSLKTIL